MRHAVILSPTVCLTSTGIVLAIVIRGLFVILIASWLAADRGRS
jgi:hypothetical protein